MNGETSCSQWGSCSVAAPKMGPAMIDTPTYVQEIRLVQRGKSAVAATKGKTHPLFVYSSTMIIGRAFRVEFVLRADKENLASLSRWLNFTITR